MAGFRGGRFLSVEASARGEWKPGGSKLAGSDAYATSKQAILAATLALARENGRLRINALEPGVIPNTGLGRDEHLFVRVLATFVLPLFAPFLPYFSTPKRAARVATQAVLNPTGQTGVYFDEGGKPMQPSKQAQDVAFQNRVVAETRAFLAPFKDMSGFTPVTNAVAGNDGFRVTPIAAHQKRPIRVSPVRATNSSSSFSPPPSKGIRRPTPRSA